MNVIFSMVKTLNGQNVRKKKFPFLPPLNTIGKSLLHLMLVFLSPPTPFPFYVKLYKISYDPIHN